MPDVDPPEVKRSAMDRLRHAAAACGFANWPNHVAALDAAVEAVAADHDAAVAAKKELIEELTANAAENYLLATEAAARVAALTGRIETLEAALRNWGVPFVVDCLDTGRFDSEMGRSVLHELDAALAGESSSGAGSESDALAYREQMVRNDAFGEAPQ